MNEGIFPIEHGDFPLPPMLVFGSVYYWDYGCKFPAPCQDDTNGGSKDQESPKRLFFRRQNYIWQLFNQGFRMISHPDYPVYSPEIAPEKYRTNDG